MSPTPKQERAAKALLDKPCYKDALLEAGYAPNTAHNPKDVIESEGFKEAKKPYVERLITLRDKAQARALETVGEAGYADAMRSTEIYTKQIQLLGGKPTEILDDYSNISTDDLIKRREGYRDRTDR